MCIYRTSICCEDRFSFLQLGIDFFACGKSSLSLLPGKLSYDYLYLLSGLLIFIPLENSSSERRAEE